MYPYPRQPDFWVWLVCTVVVWAVAVGGLLLLGWTARRPAAWKSLLLWAVYLAVAFTAGTTAEETLNPARFKSVHLPASMRYYFGIVFPAAVIFSLAAGIDLLIRAFTRVRRIVVSPLPQLFLAVIVASNIFPPISHAPEAARRTQCKRNLKELAKSFGRWQDVKGRLPDVLSEAGFLKEKVTWRIALLPFLDEDLQPRAHPELLAESLRFDPARPWDDPVNEPLAQSQVRIYICPTNPWPQDSRKRYFASYALPVGDLTAYPGEHGLDLTEITDDHGSTILLVEACGRNIVWTEPRDVELSQSPSGINRPGRAKGESAGLLSSWHRGGANVAMADGSVRFLSEKIDPAVLQALTTVAGGEPVPERF